MFELHERGSEGRTPWIFDLGANVTYQHSFAVTDLQVKLAVYNVLNQERETQINEQSRERHRQSECGVSVWAGVAIAALRDADDERSTSNEGE